MPIVTFLNDENLFTPIAVREVDVVPRLNEVVIFMHDGKQVRGSVNAVAHLLDEVNVIELHLHIF